jgi:hypothetical protein
MDRYTALRLKEYQISDLKHISRIIQTFWCDAKKPPEKAADPLFDAYQCVEVILNDCRAELDDIKDPDCWANEYAADMIVGHVEQIRKELVMEEL